MLLLALSTAFAADLPGDLTVAQLDDPAPWEARARAMLDGPPGCIQVQGRVRLQISLYTPGGLFARAERSDVVGQGTFEGTLDAGLWTRLETTWAEAPEGSSGRLTTDRFHPIVGKLAAKPGAGEGAEGAGDAEGDAGNVSISTGEDGLKIDVSDGGEAAMGVLDETLEAIDPDVTTAYVVWDAPTRQVRLHQLVALGDREDLEIVVRFPENGPPTQLDAVFPSVLKRKEDGFTFTARDAQFHLRSKVTELGVVPGSEGVSLVMGALGFTVGFDQRVTYDRVRACPAGG